MSAPAEVARYTVRPVKAWTKEGAASVAAHCVPPGEGWTLSITGFRVIRPDGATYRPAYPPHATEAEALAEAAALNEAAERQADHVAAICADYAHAGYPVDTLPMIPPGFAFNHSWMCPVFESEALDLGLCVDYPDPADRDLEDGSRFAVYRLSEARAGVGEDYLHADNWNAVLAFVDRVAAGQRPEVAVSALADAIRVGAGLAHLALWDGQNRAAPKPCPDYHEWLTECAADLTADGVRARMLPEVEAFAVQMADL